MRITAKTRICAVIGDPVEHSLSPVIHNAAFEALGLDYAYVAFHVKRGEVGEAIQGVRALGIHGLSVTIPHKADVIPHLDAIDPMAEGVGSVNTVAREDDRLVGYSSDGAGAIRALEEAGVQPAGRRVLLLGSGGAARAIAFALSALAPLPSARILGIERPELERLALDLRARTHLKPSIDDLGRASLSSAMAEAEVVIHATPVGMAPKSGETLVPAELIRRGQVVFDVVYTPLETRLLREARAAGALAVAGLGMFVHQAAVQFELWTGKRAPVELMRRVVLEALGGA
ncbi:MAG: shikimate dehydrogenase [Planctomycetota bacterium]